MKFAFLLSVYNKVDDLMAHLDILKYCPIPHEVIITYLKHDIPYLDELKQYHTIPVECKAYYAGTLLSLSAGVRKAQELGIDILCYRNADDWLFNHDFTQQVLTKMKDYDCCGYNWFTKDTFDEFAMNELFVRIATFAPTVDAAETYFQQLSYDDFCEHRITNWLKMCLPSWDRFYRLDREADPAIAHDAGAIRWIYRNIHHKPVPERVWEHFRVNNRYFKLDWQLIGSHDNNERYDYWMQIRKQVPYADALEQEPHFKRWLATVRSGGKWNIETQRVPAKKIPKKLIVRK